MPKFSTCPSSLVCIREDWPFCWTRTSVRVEAAPFSFFDLTNIDHLQPAKMPRKFSIHSIDRRCCKNLATLGSRLVSLEMKSHSLPP